MPMKSNAEAKHNLTKVASSKEFCKLVIIDKDADFLILEQLFAQSLSTRFQLYHYRSVSEFEENIDSINYRKIDAMLVDFSIETKGIKKVYYELTNLLPSIPIIAIGQLINEQKTRVMGEIGIFNAIEKNDLNHDGLISNVIHVINLYKSLKSDLQKANYDSLTRLANRTLLENRAQHALEITKRSERSVALMIIDLDDFKLVNDHYGHDMGDLFLQNIAYRLKDCVRVSDTVARLGGDEFAILLEGIEYPELILQLAKKIINIANQPIVIKGKKITPSLSIGISLLNTKKKNRFSYDWLFQSADTALYEAKKSGKNTFSFFTDKNDVEMIRALKLEDDVIDAFKKEQFCVYYQPIFDIKNEELCSVEALLRWRRKDGTVVQPEQFLSTIEKLGMMEELGEFVLAQSIRQVAEWIRQYKKHVGLHINISPAQFMTPGFYEQLSSLISVHGVPSNIIELELTEQNFFKNSKYIEREFAKLKWLGVKLAIDDFGTGYSSYDYIRRFNINSLKIDKSFIHAMFTSDVDMAIVQSMTTFAKKLNINVIAEGVESRREMDSLIAMGVDQVQGFYKGKPLSVEQFSKQYLIPKIPNYPKPYTAALKPEVNKESLAVGV